MKRTPWRLKALFCIMLGMSPLYSDDSCSTDCSRSSKSCSNDSEKSCLTDCTRSSKSCSDDESLKTITTFIPRSQGTNTARELVGWQRQLYRCYNENYAALALTAEYTRSRNTCPIARHMFTTNCLTFSGSQFAERKDTDILADYFGLPVNFHGTLAIEPEIQNYIIDLNLYFGLDELFPGFFIRLHSPLTHTKWSLGLDACISCGDKFRGCEQFPECYMSAVEQPSAPLSADCPVNATLNPLNQYNNNCATQSLREALSGNFTFGQMKEAWKYGRFDFCPRNKTGLADIDVMIGINVLHNDYAHFGFFALTVIPTGNRPKAKYIFEPLVGDGKHWKAGGGATMHFSLASNTEQTVYNAGIYIEGNVVHVFSTDQKRSFDFTNNGPLSRYVLLKEFDPECTNGIFQNSYTYTGNLINAINFATRNCEVRIGLEADVSAKIFFTSGGWTLDLGYNYFFRDREKICIKTDCPCDIDSRFFGFKGTEPVCLEPAMTSEMFDRIPAPSRPEGASTQQPLPSSNDAGPSQGSALSADQKVTQANIREIFGNTSYNSSSGKGVRLQPTTSYENDYPHQPSEPNFISNSESSSIQNYEDNYPNSNEDNYISRPSNPTGVVNNNVQPDATAFAPGTAIRGTKATFVTCNDLDPQSAAQGQMMTHKAFGHLSYTWHCSCYSPHIGIGGELEFDAHNNNALEQWGIWLKGGLMF